MISRIKALLVAASLFALSAPVSSSICPDAEVFGEKMISGICWRCIFPIKLAGSIALGSSADSISDNKPPDDSPSSVFCACPDSLGVPRVGISMSLWEPAKLVELVRAPYCSTALGGMRLQDSLKYMGSEKPSSSDVHRLSKFQMHYYAFPILNMLDLFTEASCNSDGYMDMDIAYMTELDPTWNRPGLAALVNFETMLFANPAAKLACSVESMSVNAGGGPIQAMHWCAGSWGSLYPMTGNFRMTAANSGTSLLASRGLAMLHRRGLAKQTVGAEAQCKPQFFPTIPKQQYKMSMFFPVAEAKGNHWIGESTFRWGTHRNVPGLSPDALYLVYRWRDCCSIF
jgi:conjugal transfer pilus assembly protein TraU